jgi:OOP family OmpA-OmpF porin
MRGTFFVVLVFASSIAIGAPKYVLNGDELVVPFPIVYETGKAVVMPESDEALDYIKGYLAAKTHVTKLRIEVHTDSQGRDEYNQTMSEARALAFTKALVAKGVGCHRLVPVGFGETKPIADNRTADGRAKNRRTGIFNAALRGRPIGGGAIDGGGKVAGDPCN